HVRQWVWDHLPIVLQPPILLPPPVVGQPRPIAPPRPVAASTGRVSEIVNLSLTAHDQTGSPNVVETALPALQFTAAGVVLPASAGALPAGALVARVVAG